MLYSRPDIKPLNLDLEALPFREHMRGFSAKTTDEYPIHIRFSSGYLSAYRGEKGKEIKVLKGETLLVQSKVMPFGYTDIMPEQICDVLGLTVQGKKIEGPDEEQTKILKRDGYHGGAFFDLSGRTTYWQSSHLMRLHNDADGFIELVKTTFPGCVMYQTKSTGNWKTVRYRRVPFILQSDDYVGFGIGGQKEAIESFFEEVSVDRLAFKDVFPFSFGFRRREHIPQGGVSKHGREIIEKQGASKLGIRFNLTNVQEYFIGTEFNSADSYAQDCMSKLIYAINQYFHRGLSALDMQTGKVVKENVFVDWLGTGYYSTALKNWCLEKPNNYIKVGYENPEQVNGEPQYATNGVPVFYGIRPAN